MTLTESTAAASPVLKSEHVNAAVYLFMILICACFTTCVAGSAHMYQTRLKSDAFIKCIEILSAAGDEAVSKHVELCNTGK
jgi:hypothetical protein